MLVSPAQGRELSEARQLGLHTGDFDVGNPVRQMGFDNAARTQLDRRPQGAAICQATPHSHARVRWGASSSSAPDARQACRLALMPPCGQPPYVPPGGQLRLRRTNVGLAGTPAHRQHVHAVALYGHRIAQCRAHMPGQIVDLGATLLQLRLRAAQPARAIPDAARDARVAGPLPAQRIACAARGLEQMRASGLTSSAAPVGVGARTSATKSAIVKSVS
jgi:hypothetical protein